MVKDLVAGCLAAMLAISCGTQNKNAELLLQDDFESLPRGPMVGDVGAHTEYHFLHEAKPTGNWAVSTFRYNLPPSWYVRDFNGDRSLFQKEVNRNSHWHPMVAAGSEFWNDYRVELELTPFDTVKRIGAAFRYQNDRQYYFFGMENDSVKLLKVDHAVAFRKPAESLLAARPYTVVKGKKIRLTIDVSENTIEARVGDEEVVLTAKDDKFTQGKIALLADGPAAFHRVEATTQRKSFEVIQEQQAARRQRIAEKMAGIPKPVVYKKFSVDGFGVGRNLRFGDLDNDGEIDILIGQVVHHGFKDRNSELSCLTAVNLDGEILWQIGKPDPWKDNLTSDVAFQIHDIDQDGRMEVIYCMNQRLIIADGETGKTIREIPTPLTPGGKPLPSGQNIFPRILGDAIYFCDLTGQGYDGDFILKDRYRYLWAFNSQLELLWHNECNTGHYPYAYDLNSDGKDELIAGYTLFDANGNKLWTLDSVIRDHADGVAIVSYLPGKDPVFMCAASDEGMFFADAATGEITRHHYIGHVQNPAVANLRDDLDGLETVSVNFWANQGIIHLFDARGLIYHTFEPNQYGSMCLPLNWTGKSEELYILNANVDEGGAWDGWGDRILEFPDDGHPDLCYAVLDIVGDCRDEIVVWDTKEVWVYTQEDNPKSGRLYKPVRNPLYNYSNYQATVSEPGWNDDEE